MLKQIIKSKAFLAFISGLLLYFFTVLPDVIQNGGILMYYGGYRLQTIPFTFHLHDRLLDWGWDHSTGLGGGFLTQYAYYNLFSPFTFIYALIPRAALLYSMPYVTSLKYAVGAMIAYFYLKRFTKDPNYAVIGSVIYTFSTFNAYNMAFHFIDTLVFFPLLLTALEELCGKGRRGVFALTVTFMALINYYFFFGEVIFTVIYFFVRFSDKSSGFSLRRLPAAATESVIGTAMAMFMLLPVFYVVLTSEKATGTIALSDMFLYGDLYRYLKIAQSMFMIPDTPGFASLFPETAETYPYGTVHASVAAYLPLFSLAGVIAYFCAHKKTWEKILLSICLICAFVPVLNQSFSGFNSAYYARWYYMPLLIMTLVSVKALEDGADMRAGFSVCAGVVFTLTVYNFVMDRKAFSESTKAWSDPNVNLLFLGVTIINLVILAFAAFSERDRDYTKKLYIFACIAAYLSYGVVSFNIFNESRVADNSIIAGHYRYDEAMPDYVSDDDRIAQTISPMEYTGLNFIWGKTSTSYFNSLPPNGYIEFTYAAGLTDDKIQINDISAYRTELCDICSVKYCAVSSAEANSGLLDMYEKRDSFGYYTLMENPRYIPMGFTYDLMITKDSFGSISDSAERHRAYMKYLVVSEPEKMPDGLTLSEYSQFDDEEYMSLIGRHRSECAYDMTKDSSGLSCRISIAKDNIVFFSIPYDIGWTAYIDGEQTDIFNVNNGLIGVKAAAGDHGLRLVYRTPYLTEGIIVSCAAAAAFAVYMLVSLKKTGKQAAEEKV